MPPQGLDVEQFGHDRLRMLVGPPLGLRFELLVVHIRDVHTCVPALADAHPKMLYARDTGKLRTQAWLAVNRVQWFQYREVSPSVSVGHDIGNGWRLCLGRLLSLSLDM